MIALYMDVHVHGAVTNQLRRRGVEVLTAQEDHRREADDDELLDRARKLQRLIFTQDEDFLALASEWQRSKRPFAGIAYGTRQRLIGRYVEDLELIAKSTELAEWENAIIFLPF
jgi:hypothetical protein